MDPLVPIFCVQPQPTPIQAVRLTRHVSKPWPSPKTPIWCSKELIHINDDKSSSKSETNEPASELALEPTLKPTHSKAAAQTSKAKVAKPKAKKPRKKAPLASSRLNDDDKLLTVRLSEECSHLYGHISNKAF